MLNWNFKAVCSKKMSRICKKYESIDLNEFERRSDFCEQPRIINQMGQIREEFEHNKLIVSQLDECKRLNCNFKSTRKF